MQTEGLKITCRQNVKQYFVRHARNDVSKKTETSNNACLTADIQCISLACRRHLVKMK